VHAKWLISIKLLEPGIVDPDHRYSPYTRKVGTIFSCSTAWRLLENFFRISVWKKHNRKKVADFLDKDYALGR
jgi:hypothetical protein